ncbi:MAG: T9SS type A sorting domain-containing protein, partial [Bacteroidota bacterium]
LSIENQQVEAGETVTVGFSSAEFEKVYGYQFTLELNGLEFKNIESGAVVMKEHNVGVLSSDVVTMSYNNTGGVTAGKDEDIFTVQFVARRTGELATMLDITSKVTKAEAYISDSYEIIDVEIETRGGITDIATSELYQNEPNPFTETTVIGFNLAEAGTATITIMDVTGKLIVKREIEGEKGYNAFNVNEGDLGTSGVFYYTLESGDFTATKKMIVIE